MTARLRAINSCLAGIGLDRVASEDEEDIDVANASETVDDVLENLLGNGWWFNREHNWKLAPETGTGIINLSANVMQIEPEGVSKYCKFVMRENKIYDMDLHTFDLSESVASDGFIYFLTIQRIPFEDCPPIVRSAITYMARRQFAQDSQVDANRWNFQVRDEQTAMEKVMIEESRSRKGNYIRDNAAHQSNLSRIGGWNAHGVNNFGFSGRRYE
jgi:hypothetical protein